MPFLELEDETTNPIKSTKKQNKKSFPNKT